MTYDITYRGMAEAFLSRMELDKPDTGDAAANLWLSEFDENKLHEAERLNVILPLIKWCVEQNKMTEPLKDELFLYFEDYINGDLKDILADYEAQKVIEVLTECYKNVFA